MKFLCDQMLGTLAKWLRILGFDTYFANDKITDDEILDISKKENRTLVTRDKELIIRAKKRRLDFIKINSTNLEIQLKQFLTKNKIDKNLFLTRCLICNSLVTKIKKEDVKNKVPKRVFENNDKFFYCKKCDKIYWMGTHTENMIEKIKKL